MLTFDQLRTVQVIARTGSFSRAGRELYLSQPAISQRVREIERLLGAELFERVRGRQGGLQLTGAGARVISFAAETLQAYDQLCADVAAAPESGASRVVVGVPGPITASRIVRVLARAPDAFKEMGLEFTPLTYVEVLDSLRTGRADYGVVVEEPESAEDLEAVLLWRDRWILAVPAGGAGEIESGSLACAIPSRGTHARRVIDASLRAAELKVVPTVEAPFVETLVEALASAGLPAFVPVSAISELLASGAARDAGVQGTPIEISGWLLYDANHDDGSVTATLLELLRAGLPRCPTTEFTD